MDFIRANNITSYEDVYALIKGDTVAPELRLTAFHFLSAAFSFHLHTKPRPKFDRRRIVPALLAALKSADQKVVGEALSQLALWGTKAAVPDLLKIATDRADINRIYAIYVLGSIRDQRAIQPLTIIANDPTEPDVARGEAIERLEEISPDEDDAVFIRNCIRWLSDGSAEVRFWASFGLKCRMYSPHLAEAVTALDHIVANDHALPVGLWHVDREAIAALEGYYCLALMREIGLHSELRRHSVSTCLVSAALEYMDSVQTYRHHEKKRTPKPIKYLIDPASFADQLQAHWPDLNLNMRSSQLSCYLLDWQLVAGNTVLIGGLLRDRYAVALTSNDYAFIREFAAVIDNFIPKHRTLYFYEWASNGSAMKFWTK
jgi:uncharacterized protein (UPF0147 family)